MADGSVTIKEIRAKFTADIQDYRQKMQALSSSIAGMDSKLEGIKRKAQAAMDSPSKSTQKLGRALNSSVTALQRSQRQFESVAQAGDRTAREMEKVSQKMAEVGKTYQAIMDAKASGIDLGTPIQKQMDAATERVDQLYNRINSLKQQLAATKGTNYTSVFDGDEMVNVADVGARLQKLTKEAEEAGQAVVKLATAIDKIGESNLNLANESGLARLRKQMEASAEKADKLSEKLSQSGKKAGEMADKVRQNSQTLNQNAKSLSRTSALYNALISAGDRLGKGLSSVKNKIAGIGNTSRSSTGKVEGLLRSIRRISIVNLGLHLARASSGIGELQSAVTRYMDTNDAAAASIKRLRNGLTNALAPAINLCVNLLSKVMPYLIGIVDAVASLITNIFGEGWTTVSTGAGAAADATKAVADNTKDAAKAQKEYNKLIAGFDEIEKLEKQSDAGGSGGSGGSGGKAKQDKAEGTEGIAGKLPKWLESLINDIDSLLTKGDFYGIGTRISETLNSATKAVDDWFNNVLRPKGVLWAGRFADVFNGLVEGYDWGLLGDTISDGLLAAIDIAGTFIRNARFESLGKGIATSINRAIKRINESDINFGSFLADLLNAGIRGLYGFASTVKWSQIGTFVANNVNKFFKTVDWKKAGRTAGKLIAGLGEMLVTAISKISISKVARAFSDFLESAGISKSLVVDIALLFAVAKGVKIASAICGALGLGATTSMAGISGIALPITLAVGSVMVMQGVAGLLHTKVKAILKEAGYDPDKDFNSNGTRKGNEHWYNSKVTVSDIYEGLKKFFGYGNKESGGKWKQDTGGLGSTKTVSSINDSAKSAGGSTWTATIKAKVDQTFEDGAQKYGTVGDKTATATTKVGKDAAYDNNKKRIYDSISDKVAAIKAKIAKDKYYDKNKKKWITSAKGKNVPLLVYLKKVKPYKVKVVTRGSVTTIDTGGYSGHGGKFAKGGVVRRRMFFGLNEVGEAGKEAIIPLERNTEWTGQVAKLLAQHLYDLPQPTTPSMYSTDNAISGSDMAELVALLRAIRSDVAAVRQNSGGSVTVNTNLDGRTIARSTIDYINGQAKATGVNPLAAYM